MFPQAFGVRLAAAVVVFNCLWQVFVAFLEMVAMELCNGDSAFVPGFISLLLSIPGLYGIHLMTQFFRNDNE